MGSTLRLTIVLVLTGCVWRGVCQQNTPDLKVYEAFFVQVAGLKNVPGPIGVNGEPGDLILPSARDAIGLNDQEAQGLDAIAADCATGIRSFDRAAGPEIFDARLRLIDTPDDLLPLRKIRDLNEERKRIVSAHIQQLKTAFGDSRFALVNSFVRSRQDAASFFPLVLAGGPVRSKK